MHIEIPKVIENASPKDVTRPVGDDFGCKVRAETHPEGTLASFDLIARLMLLSSVLIIPATCFLLPPLLARQGQPRACQIPGDGGQGAGTGSGPNR